MKDQIDAGRLIGALLFLQIVSGVIGNFVLTTPVFAQPGFLVNAAAYATHLSGSVLVGLASSALALGVTVIAFGIIRRRSEPMELWIFAIAVTNFVLAAVELTAVLAMLSLSEVYRAAPTPDESLFQALRGFVAAARIWAHYMHLLIAGGWLLVLFAALYRCTLVPRVLAVFGPPAALLQMVAVTIPLFGYRILFPLLAPIGIVLIANAGWLVIRGLGAGREATT